MLSRKEVLDLEKKGYDLGFISRIQPQGGFKPTEDKIIAGDGVYATLHVYELPKNPVPFWLTALMGNRNTVTKVDIAPLEKERALKDINNSLNEYREQATEGRTQTDRNDAAAEYRSLERYASEIKQGGEVTKLVDIRIYLVADTQEELDKEFTTLRKSLKASDYKVVAFIGKPLTEWLAFAQSYTEQQKMPGARAGLTVGTTAIGGSYPFNHKYLVDPRGQYLGQTDTGGPFIYDPFYVTSVRKSFSSILLGKPGMGKSTLLKLIEEGLFGRNTCIRGFEKNGDWKKTIGHQKGRIVDLSGRGGMLNPLEPLATITDDTGTKIDQLNSYLQHRAKFFNQIRFLNPSMRSVDVLDFGKILDAFYIEKGLLPDKYMAKENQTNINIIGLDPKQYPIMSEFHTFLNHYVNNGYKDRVTSVKMVEMENFLSVIDSMTNQYGSIFNGTTSFKNLNDEQVLFFDIETIGHFDTEIYKCLLFTAMNIVWNQALNNGRRQKIALANNEIEIDDVVFFAFFLDECQEILSPDTVFVVTQVVKFLKEMRKFSAGAFFATQSPQELLPENSSDDYISKIKQVFELCSSKFFLGLDASVAGTMRKAMGSLLTEGQYNDLALMEQGEVFINLGGTNNYKITTDPDEKQLIRFAGGH
ncbi:VirB4 family type IV secretion system protein [Enterococcus sp. AZ051]|uniref:VirB4 family type IV secretion system protein n=1 Tax=Enterococcus sp. AZ051 TaxID=2774698 RepID=UPI003D2A3021